MEGPIATSASFAVTKDHLSLDPALVAGRSSIDVVINGHRVWSMDLVAEPLPAGGVKRWPMALRPYLDGRAEMLLVDSASGEEIAERVVRFGRSSNPVTVMDSQGRWLAVNKWGRMGKSFAGADEGLRERLLDRLDELVVFCEKRELRPFVVGGTLLGAVRGGEILGHDDDADLAYLSRHRHPSDLALESFAIERELVGLGIEVVRHSAAHLQLTFRACSGKVDGYVDLFTAFFRDDGTVNQPFHVRGPMAESSMLPFSTVTLEGRSYPAPAVPEDWLVVNYDENWRTPLPGYRLQTPRATQRRFRNWFGSLNFQRDFWEDRYDDVGEGVYPRQEDVRAARHLAGQVPAGSRVLDLGCGDGAATAWLSSHGFDVTAVDYAPNALARTRERLRAEGAEATLARYNLNDFRDRAELLGRLAGAEPAHVIASHLLERMGHLGRQGVLRLLRQTVRRGGRVVIVIDSRPAWNLTFTDPSTWHLAMRDLTGELSSCGLMIVNQRRLREKPRDRKRRPILFELAPSPESMEGTTA